MDLSVLWATVRMLPRVGRLSTVLLGVVAVAQPLLGLGFMLAVGRFVGGIPHVVAGRSDSWATDLGVVAGIYIAGQLLSAFAGVLEWRLGQRLDHHLNDRTMAILSAPPGIAHLENPRVRDLASQAADGLGAGWWRPTRTPGSLRAVVSGVLSMAFAFGVIGWHQWWLGLLVAAAASWALYAVIAHSVVMILGLVRTSGESEFRRMEYERDAAVSAASAKEVRLFGFGPWVLDRWQRRLERVLALDLRNIAKVGPNLVASVLASTLVIGGGFVWAAFQVSNGNLDLASATVLAQALLAPLVQFGPGGQAIINLTLCGRPVKALLELERLTGEYADEPTADRPLPVPADAPREGISFENVTFRYPGTDTDVLRGLDLEIPAGTSVAVVGLNGAGKTTLVKLLCRFYEPTSGRITVDGTDLRDLDQRAWQRRVAAIFQDFARYPLSARDNIGFGSLGAPDERIEAAADRSGIWSVLVGLPKGLDTTLSREFDEGADLSGGEWQRVALSRALLAAESEAGVLILDEPAANLDVRAEAELNERFLDLTPGLTTLLISHRFSSVRRADHIVVLDDGRVVESGTHDELVSADGRYATLFRMQAERFAV